jgi:hypothetical protein
MDKAISYQLSAISYQLSAIRVKSGIFCKSASSRMVG